MSDPVELEFDFFRALEKRLLPCPWCGRPGVPLVNASLRRLSVTCAGPRFVPRHVGPPDPLCKARPKVTAHEKIMRAGRNGPARIGSLWFSPEAIERLVEAWNSRASNPANTTQLPTP